MFGKKKKKGPKEGGNEAEGLDEPAVDISSEGEPEKRSFLKKIFSLKFLIVLFLILLILGGGGFAGWYFFLKVDPEDEVYEAAQVEQIDDIAEEGTLLPPEPDFPDVFDLEPFENVRIEESGNLFHVTFNLSVELVKPEMRDLFESNVDSIREVIEKDMNERSWIVLRSSGGKIKMKYQLIQKINRALPSSMVRNIYIRSMMFH